MLDSGLKCFWLGMEWFAMEHSTSCSMSTAKRENFTNCIQLRKLCVHWPSQWGKPTWLSLWHAAERTSTLRGIATVLVLTKRCRHACSSGSRISSRNIWKEASCLFKNFSRLLTLEWSSSMPKWTRWTRTTKNLKLKKVQLQLVVTEQV